MSPSDHDHDAPVRGFSPSLVALVIGVSASLPMYLWLGNPQVSIACFIIAGYTAWLWAQAQHETWMQGIVSAELRSLRINRPGRRFWRMLLDPGFWWTMVFGGVTVSASVWYAGLRDAETIAGLCGAWCLVAGCLSYGLTLVHPTTRCRRCAYDLSAQMARPDGKRGVRCPECGARWSRAQLHESPPAMPIGAGRRAA